VEGLSAASILLTERQTPTNSHTPPSVEEESSGRQFDRKLTLVCPPQQPLS
jgi:hypothetical protein